MATGFIIALFAEMWGFPLSIFLITTLVGGEGLPYQFDNLVYYFTQTKNPSDAAFTNMPLSFFVEYTFARGVTFLAILPIIYGWVYLKKNLSNGLVTGGPYAYSRNPQYIGFILFTVGMVLYWPTLITIPMRIILCIACYRLAFSEQKELKETYKEEYDTYAKRVNRFIGKGVYKIFSLPRNLGLIEKIVVGAALTPFFLWFAEALVGLFLGEAVVRSFWFPIAYLFPVHIGIVISICLLVPAGVYLICKWYLLKKKKLPALTHT